MLATRFARLIAWAAICGGLLVNATARAQSCNVSIPNVDFGPVDVTANAASNASSTISVTCTALLSVALRVCVNLGPGGGGALNASARYMKSGANSMTYGLFSDPGATSPVGSNFWAGGGGSPIVIDFPLFIGTVTRHATLYGQVSAGQQSVPVGSYASHFSSSDATIQYGLLSLVSCNLLTSTASTTFDVAASVAPNCSITANNLNFGTLGVLNAAVEGGTTVSPQCTNGTPYTVGLNGGLSSATDPTQRKMTKAGEYIFYGLYRDAARTQPFGDSAGINTVSGTGSGLAQSVPVYGRIPPQITPSSGLYADTIIVTLTF
ncbi:spore coat U domain-containing protein [Methylocystis sp. JAN1]|uniref:Csu type fimbrial protein n=1 Tax=Methylocystis sp. JAN1 TaxID=3397211 RepID=UPI003FA243A3